MTAYKYPWTTAPLGPEHLADCRMEFPMELGRLMWSLSTPYALAEVALAEAGVMGAASAMLGGGQGWITFLDGPPRAQEMLVPVLLERMQEAGASTQYITAREKQATLLEAHGFRPLGRMLRYAGGQFREATLDQVVHFDPRYRLGMAHVLGKAVGNGMLDMVLEHDYLTQLYVDEGRVDGVLVPLLGQGLILAGGPRAGLELQRWLWPVQEEMVLPEENATAHEHLVECGYQFTEEGLFMARGEPHWRPEMIYGWCW